MFEIVAFQIIDIEKVSSRIFLLKPVKESFVIPLYVIDGIKYTKPANALDA